MGNEFVDALRARLVMNGDLGTRFMSGLKGDVAIPKLATGVAAGFVAENGATSGSKCYLCTSDHVPAEVAGRIHRRFPSSDDPI